MSVPRPLRWVETAPQLHVATASEWKTILLYVNDAPQPHGVMRMTSEPAPMMRLGYRNQLFYIVDVQEHIDGDYSVYTVPFWGWHGHNDCASIPTV